MNALYDYIEKYEKVNTKIPINIQSVQSFFFLTFVSFFTVNNFNFTVYKRFECILMMDALDDYIENYEKVNTKIPINIQSRSKNDESIYNSFKFNESNAFSLQDYLFGNVSDDESNPYESEQSSQLSDEDIILQQNSFAYPKVDQDTFATTNIYELNSSLTDLLLEYRKGLSLDGIRQTPNLIRKSKALKNSKNMNETMTGNVTFEGIPEDSRMSLGPRPTYETSTEKTLARSSITCKFGSYKMFIYRNKAPIIWDTVRKCTIKDLPADEIPPWQMSILEKFMDESNKENHQNSSVILKSFDHSDAADKCFQHLQDINLEVSRIEEFSLCDDSFVHAGLPASLWNL